ncbi:MAG: chromate transporter [Alphaproteobacteria bacterium]|nr:chromate transporter [Alphaproteobacteria bacterium]
MARPVADLIATPSGVSGADASVGLWRIFSVFLRLGSTSFGGGTAGWLHRDIVLRRGWIDEADFIRMLSLGQVLPGANGIKMTVLIGQRLRGVLGALAALFGLLAGPFVIVLALGAIYARLSGIALLHHMLDGAAAAVIGLTLATGLRAAGQGSPGATGLAFTAVTVFCVGVLRWPMLPVLVVLAPLSIGLAWRQPRSG